MDYLDIVMEAESKRKKAKEAEKDTKKEDNEDMPEDIEPTDYSEEDPDNEEDPPKEGTEPDDGAEPTDYTGDDSPELSDTEEGPSNEPEDGAEPTDYSEDAAGEGEDVTDGDGAPPDEGTEPTDYSDDGSEEQPEGMDGVEGDNLDAGEMEPEAPQDDIRSVRLLLEDYINIYNRCKDFLSKMDNIDRSDAIVSQVILQVKKNIERIKIVVWEYISYEYDKNNYVMNLYRYNQFIEAFKLNIQMLSRTKDYLKDRYEREDKIDKKSNRASKSKNS